MDKPQTTYREDLVSAHMLKHPELACALASLIDAMDFEVFRKTFPDGSTTIRVRRK